MHSISEGIKQILHSKKIAIISHINADADAICSSMALKLLIKARTQRKHETPIIDIFTDTEQISDLYLPIVSHLALNKQRFKKYDLAISLDCPNVYRLGRFKEIFCNAKDTLMIDHHDTCENFARNNICKKVSSTCEIIYNELILKRNWKANEETYRLLYTGIITDTNDLTQNTLNSTHHVIADLMEVDTKLGLSLESIKDHFFKNTTKQKTMLFQRALQSLAFFENDQIAIMKIFKQDLIETGCKQEDTLGIVDYAVKMKGVKVGVIFIKQEDNSYYVSLRSKDKINVGIIAKSLGGGGHFNVSAFQSKEPLADLKQQIITLCKQQFSTAPTGDEEIENLFTEDI